MACSTGTPGASSTVSSPGSAAAKAVSVTMIAGSIAASACFRKAAEAGSRSEATKMGFGDSPRAASASHSASTGAVSPASHMER